jgi:hypothetical protein
MLKKIGLFVLVLSSVGAIGPATAFGQEYYHRDRDYYAGDDWNSSRRHEHRREERREHRSWREHEWREHEWREHERAERRYYDRRRYSPYGYSDGYRYNYPY